MPDQTMIERVARALLRQKLTRDGHPGGRALDATIDHEWAKFSDYARVAIAIMREPSESMETAGLLPAMSRDPAMTWKVMIDVALSEGD